MKLIYEKPGEQNGVKVVCYGSNCKLKGKSGNEYQLDVLTAHSDGLHEYLTYIECKHWEREVDKDVVMKVSSIVEDCGLSKGVIVSSSGFTASAERYAREKGIGLVILSEPTENDLVRKIDRLEIGCKVYVRNVSASFKISVNSPFETNVIDHSENFYIGFLDGNTVNAGLFVSSLADSYEDPKDIGKSREIELKMPEKTLLLKDDGSILGTITSITLKIECKQLKDITVRIEYKDRVWLIMKAIFEGKEFFVSKNLEIIESLPSLKELKKLFD